MPCPDSCPRFCSDLPLMCSFQCRGLKTSLLLSFCSSPQATALFGKTNPPSKAANGQILIMDHTAEPGEPREKSSHSLSEA